VPAKPVYDAVPYIGSAFAQTHPDLLAAHATLYGLEPPPVETSRVLEIGCTDGGNLLPMAASLPRATFVGIDSAVRAIERARGLADQLELGNVTFLAQSIEDYEVEPGEFDYVIAHGFYSWVPEPVRDRLLALCRRGLADGGVAYVSYNALPGAHPRHALREMLLFHVGPERDVSGHLPDVRGLLSFLVATWPKGDPFADAMRPHAERLLERPDMTLVHDDLAENFHSVHFHEFAAHAARHGLRYLAEADYVSMQIGLAAAPVADTLNSVPDRIRREQYLDFLKGRAFRQTLLCHAEEAVPDVPAAAALERLAVSTPIHATGEGEYRGPGGTTLSTGDEPVRHALAVLEQRWPAAAWIRDLAPAGEDRARLCETLLGFYAMDLVQLHAHLPPVSPAPGERPRVTALARHQAGAGDHATSVRHTRVVLEDEFDRRLVVLLDGTRDRAALREALAPAPDDLERRLRRLAEHAMLLDS
jgi:SAM-dependent methyltransferase